ncbi:MAG: GNAT family N-acetyltransferase [Caldilineaceae bacterium]
MPDQIVAPRLLTPADADRAAEVLGRAFLDDPLNLYLYPDAAKRAARTPALYAFFARLGLGEGLAHGAGEPLASVAVWNAPGVSGMGFRALLRARPWRLVFSPFLLSAARVLPVFSQFDRMQKQYAPEPHVYLQTIGTLPEAQGKGYGSALLRTMIAEADAARLPIYTETMTPSNVPLYEHFGFVVREEYVVPNTKLRIWCFTRPALL